MDGRIPQQGGRERAAAKHHERVHKDRAFVASLALSPPDPSLLKADDLDRYIAHRMMPYRRIGGAISVVSVSEADAAQVRACLPGLPPVLETVLTSGREFDAAIREAFSEELSRRATDALYDASPEFSARQPVSRGVALASAAFVLAAGFGTLTDPVSTASVVLFFMMLYVLLSTGLKAGLVAAALRSGRATPQAPGTRSPVVTILVPLFRESRAVGTLTAAMERLRYPKDRLDVKYLIEEGDAETWKALESIKLPAFVEVISIPHSIPQTKPKAMNYALPFARGELLGIFDAEDIPDPDQIRKAVDAMDRAPDGTVCVQARLNHFNDTDSLVSRGAAMEYAMWFDVLLTGLSALRLPVPLGGTSLYIRTDALREVGGWDPDNVTEDADLGLRLARRGWRAALFDSTTLEEAPERCGQWIGQRSRWVKGFIVTWLVHMRQPRRTVADLGWRHTLAINLMLLDGFAAFLMQPLFWAALIYGIAALAVPSLETPPGWLMAASFIVFLLGQAVVLGAAAIAVARRFGPGRALWTPLLWAYWQMGMVAALRAVWELMAAPNLWVKTEHGVGRHVDARRAAALRRP